MLCVKGAIVFIFNDHSGTYWQDVNVDVFVINSWCLEDTQVSCKHLHASGRFQLSCVVVEFFLAKSLPVRFIDHLTESNTRLIGPIHHSARWAAYQISSWDRTQIFWLISRLNTLCCARCIPCIGHCISNKSWQYENMVRRSIILTSAICFVLELLLQGIARTLLYSLSRKELAESNIEH